LKILIISNTNQEEVEEDLLIANSFRRDGHEVSVVDSDYDDSLDNYYDVFIKRNAYYKNNKSLDIFVDELRKRLLNKNKIMINFNGKFDTNGKYYLVDLYNRGYPVIPTVSNIADVNNLPKSDKYIIKPLNSYDGIGQKKLTFKELNDNFEKGHAIQPEIRFEKEVQFYFVNNIFCYALEFVPSKVPIYPDANNYDYREDELELAKSFANLNKGFIGVQRIDFLKTIDGKLFLIEIEDSSPYLDLDMLTKDKLETFLAVYKNMVYKYFN